MCTAEEREKPLKKLLFQTLKNTRRLYFNRRRFMCCSSRTFRKSGNRGGLGPCVGRRKSGGRRARSSSTHPVTGAVQGVKIPTTEDHQQHDLRRKRSRGLLSGLLF